MLASRVIKIEQLRTRQQGSGQVCRPPLASSFPAAIKTSISSFLVAFLPGSGRYAQTAPDGLSRAGFAKGTSPEKFPAGANLNRQTREFRNAVTYRKQTAVNCSNRQNIQKSESVFFAASPARPVSPRTNASTKTEL